MTKKALVTGITGQDGSYLAELLLSKGYEVHGVIRRASTFNTLRINHIFRDPHEQPKLTLHYGDLTDPALMTYLIYNIQPDEIYNLGAQSHVRVSFDAPYYAGEVNALGVTTILEAVRRSGIKTRVYQASSSEMFGDSAAPQGEWTALRPRSPYACSKVYAFWMAKNYRDGYGLHVSNGILFNHESPRRGETFVTRKVTRAIAHIAAGKQNELYLGSLDAWRDWGYAPEYVEAMWRILQLEKPVDVVIGSGHSYTVRQFVNTAFEYVGLDPEKYVKFDAKYLRPTEVYHLQADASLAAQLFGWSAVTKFENLVQIMVDADMEKQNLMIYGAGRDFVKKNLTAEFLPWHKWEDQAISME